MTVVTIGAGIGGFAAIAAQPTYGAAFVTPTRTLAGLKSGKATFDPKKIQGGPYLRNGAFVNIGSGRILLAGSYPWAKGTLTMDVMNTGHALLLATALGSSAQLTALGTTSAYELGGTSGATISIPDKQNGGTSGCCFDMQWGVNTTDGVQHPVNFHSCMITKATWVFDKTGMVTAEYEFDAQYLEVSTTLITPSPAAAPIPFSMNSSSSAFETGTYGSEAQVDGITKATYTLERKLDTESLWHLGETTKDLPVTIDDVVLTLSLESNYTGTAKTALWDLFLSGAATSVLTKAVGNPIGSSGHNDPFQLDFSNAFVDSGAEPNLDPGKVINGNLMLSGTLDSSADPALSAVLVTADTTF